ncbi:MAG: xylose isomerase [Deltaproteobacteria bacterium]|nr:xylose isomerase [Deltaproteobacteria bacterium]
MRTYFPEIKHPVRYEGPDTRNPLAFRWYDPARKVRGIPMADHLKFSVAYWHAFCGAGADPFGLPSLGRAWRQDRDPMGIAAKTLDAAFEFFVKIGVRYYCFHDRDMAPEGKNVGETRRNLETMVGRARTKQDETGVRLMWGTAALAANPRYTHGAGTNPDPLVFAHAAGQVRQMIDATVALGGTGYVFWGGREGYSTLLNTDMKQERLQYARLLEMAVEYGARAGFSGMFFVEPKPREPSTHQYDFDAATTLGFLREFGLLDHFMLNIEANHATLAGHTFEHELQVAADAGKLGSMDINRGDPTLGWDTDQFPTDLPSATMAVLIVLRQGGFRYGGLNFDAKVRRGSFDTVDLFHAHIGAMDTMARALLVADRIIKDGVLDGFVSDRYAGWRTGIGGKVLKGKATLPELEEHAARCGEPGLTSGRQEMLESILNDYLYCSRIE